MIRRFLGDEGGAVSVDWVVLTAALTGLGLATVAVVSGGVESLSRDTADTLSGVSIQTRFATRETLLSTDFSGGMGAWIGGTVASLAGFGDVLQLGPGETAHMELSVPPGSQSATITFDMLGIDDLSGEAATVYVNGQPVATYSDDHGRITTEDLGASGITVNVSQQYTNDPVGAGSHGHDSRATYTITVDDPGETLTFGVGSGSGQPISEEFYAIDDVDVVAE
jgi:Flp pilus assembly pilin Flp